MIQLVNITAMVQSGLCSNMDTIHTNGDGKTYTLKACQNMLVCREQTWSFHPAVALHYDMMVQWSLVLWHAAQVFYDATWCSRNEMQAFSILPLAQMGRLTEQMAMLRAIVNLVMLHTRWHITSHNHHARTSCMLFASTFKAFLFIPYHILP